MSTKNKKENHEGYKGFERHNSYLMREFNEMFVEFKPRLRHKGIYHNNDLWCILRLHRSLVAPGGYPDHR